MAKHKTLIPYLIMILLALTILVLMFYMIPNRYQLNTEVIYDVTPDFVSNPSIGFAPNAESTRLCKDSSLVFIELTWAQWEPFEGVFDTDFLEGNFQLKKWQEAGKHAVLRFVCDLPGDEKHMDIPEWLYNQTGDGTFYSGESGQGYCPNYENSIFIAKHTAAVKALADYFNKSDFLSFVEVGSVGNWGEWHARDNSGNSLMPSSETCWEYVDAYTNAFTIAKMLMRRSYIYAADDNLGLYNDMLGDESATLEFLDWTENGGSQDASEGSLEIVPMESFWNYAPSGGEITSDTDPESMYGNQLPDLIQQIDNCHISFLGPNIPDTSKYASACDAILSHMGYKFYVEKLTTTFDFSKSAIRVNLTWCNAGNAPAYWDYPVTLCVYNSEEEMVYWESVDIQLTQLSSGMEIITENSVPYDAIKDGFTIGVMVTDMDGSENIILANEDLKWNEDVQILYQYEKKT